VNSTPQSVVNSPTNTVNPCGSVFRLSDVIRTSGKKKSFQIGTAFWNRAWRDCEGLEHYLGSRALVERSRLAWPEQEGTAPNSAKELFALAASGSQPALQAVSRHAADIGRLAAGCIGLLDPGLIVLGGGVGRNTLMTGEIERVASELTWPTTIAVSALQDAGTALGAMKLALDYSLGLLLREDRHPAVVLPPV